MMWKCLICNVIYTDQIMFRSHFLIIHRIDEEILGPIMRVSTMEIEN